LPSPAARSDLSDAGAATTGAALEAVAAELRERFEIAVSVDAQVQREPSAEVREQLSRIVREAIANAARHGGAKRVVVVLRVRRDGVALHVTDDGRGIAAPGGTGGSEGFGLRSMRERAASLGGSLTVRDRRGGGTELDIVLP
jgi:signal transduction histidine kinase